MLKNSEVVSTNVNILLVEDCPDSQEIFRHALKKIGANIVCANNGKECVDLALSALGDKKGFDVILMDLQMPVMDGLCATRALRKEGYNLPILAMTARSGPNDSKESENAGFDGHISKLTGMGSLVSEVKKQIFRKKTVEIEMPVLPLVPQFLRDNPSYAEIALSSLNTLEKKIHQLHELIVEEDFAGVKDITYQFGNLSLYGYSQFSQLINQIQLAAENDESDALKVKFETLERAAKAIIAGIPQLKKISQL